MDRNKTTALTIGLAAGIVNGVLFSLKSGIVVGVTFGIVAVIIVCGVVAIVMRATSENSEASFKETLLFHLSSDVVFDLCEKALSVVRNHKVRLRDQTQGKLIVKLGMTWTSTGEVIMFQLKEGGAGITLLEITSAPIIRSPVYNYENTEKILSYLREFAAADKKSSGVA